MTALELLGRAPVVPVMVIADAPHAVDAARSMCDGGLGVLEVTLRTASAYDAIRRIRDELPQAVVGAGSVLGREQWQRACDHGAQFGVSPGLTPDLASAVLASGLPFVPGVATAAEVMRALDQGFEALKLFPAEAVGGLALLRSLYGPMPHARFCPTGGIDATRAAAYLELPNVACVGGTWLTPPAAMAAHDWPSLRELAAHASRLRRGAGPM